MAIYRFRVTFEDQDDVARDIEIRSTQTFEDLHHGIHSAIGFDASKQASFYLSDDHWTKGQEFTNRELKESEKENIFAFRKSRLCDYISDPHQKIYYIFDPEAQWAFLIEMIKIVPSEELNASYPRCIKINGEAPKQYGTLPVLHFQFRKTLIQMICSMMMTTLKMMSQKTKQATSSLPRVKM